MLQIRSRELGFLGVRRAVHAAFYGVVFVGAACSAGDPPALQDVGVDEKEPSSSHSSESNEQAENPDDFLGEETIEVPVDCGDGLLAGEAEFCDDGNNDDGDGCSEACQVEVGWSCPNPGRDCEFSNYCGDSRLTPPEQCDDSNVAAGDGCDFNCKVEADWVCPMPGMPCQFAAVCGDGTRSALEQCDDGNTEPGDGCSEVCAAELGFVCGDSIVAGVEDCDDGNASARDGCSPDCLLEPPRWDPDTNSMIGFVCDKPGEACRASVCGDGVLEGGEPCDDGNNGDMGDGCSPGCRLEPDCSAEDGSCVSNCGDGLILPGDAEECDDGNNEPGDGCDTSCRIEGGFECPVVSEEGAVDLPIVYRDFKGVGWEGGVYYADGHPDFENEQFSRNTPKTTAASSSGMTFMDIAGPTLGLVDATLGAGQSGSAALKPVFASSGMPAQITSAATFEQWYTDVPGINLTIPSNLQLTMTGPNVFQFDTAAFYPLDDQGLVAAEVESARPTDWLGQGCGSRQPDGQWQNLTGGSHNFSFTSEVRYWFEYEGGEQLVFRGDDDVWVFIKRQLVVDLGGNHEGATRVSPTTV